ncbi:hypothetical protein F0L74_16645 [Chitinophaga agrisoli]|uniref:Uncharacterized protein n=1 Tax=Chitinophaga agrisoli TaxID=2607653 RepID=A0A5B2VP79_9BACT|nr:hypothetical protein [Chitinophaga agrisoli]KAA2241523.1 hypothetical protein F0L74_16645 [Chitinophaga agrisoli]
MTPLHEILQLIEGTFNIGSRPIYNACGFYVTSYNNWRKGRSKTMNIHAHEAVKAIIGINLYKSQQEGKIIVINKDVFEAWYTTLPSAPSLASLDSSVFQIIPEHTAA